MTEKSYRILIIAPVDISGFNDRIKAAVTPVLAPDFSVDVWNLPHGTPYIESRYATAQNAPYVIDKAVQAEQDGYDGIFVCDFDYTGVEMCRECVDIPVVGAFEPTAYMAMSVSQCFSIVTLSQHTVAMQRAHPLSHGIYNCLSSIRTVDMMVDELSDLEKVRAKVLAAAELAIREDGAQSIIMGCTGFMDVAAYVTDELAKKRLPAPVLDPSQTAVSCLQGMVRAGHRQSRMTYLTPPNFHPSEPLLKKLRPKG